MIYKFAETEAEIADRVSRFVKAELKQPSIIYAELAEWLRENGLM